MSMKRFLLVAVLAVTSVSVCIAQAKPSGTSTGSSFTLTVKLAKAVAKVGEPLPMVITISNTTANPVKITVSAGARASKFLSSRVIVRDAKGEALRATAFYHSLNRPSKLAKLAAEHSVTRKYDLAKMFDPSQPGEYTVQVVEADTERNLAVESNIAAFRITQ